MGLTTNRLTHLEHMLATMAPGDTITLHSGAANPTQLAAQLAQAAPYLKGVRVYSLMPLGPVPYGDPPACDALDIATALPGTLRKALGAGHVTALREPLSYMPTLFPPGARPAGAVLLRVSPPDTQGRVNLGVSVDYMREAVRNARWVIAEIDPRVPRVQGNAWIDAARIDAWVDAQDGPHEAVSGRFDAIDDAIAGHVASLVDDGATVELGAGSLPDRVLARLAHLRHVGLHTGIIGDGAHALIEQGVIDNSRKAFLPGVSVATMAVGSRALYDFLDDNPAVELHPCALTHGRSTLVQLPNLHAINSALYVDLAGQTNAEWAGDKRISMPGGLPDFARAAAAQPKAKSIIALRACDKNGKSSIVPALANDKPATLLPNEVDYCVTEYGIAQINGTSASARRQALIAIAHPEHRDALRQANP